MFHFFIIVIVSLISVDSFVPPQKSSINSLPGWPGVLPVDISNGWLDVGPAPRGPDYTMYEHYMMVKSERNYDRDPVIVWLNGGPGASSLFGLFVELGPLLLNEQSFEFSDAPMLVPNKFAWTKVATVVVVDHPPPVGFSYCDGPGAGVGGNGTSCGAWNDDNTAQTLANFMETFFFKVYPELASHDIYLAGESYAGVYVTTTIQELLKRNFHKRTSFQGFALGDACLGTDVICGTKHGLYYFLKFFYGHGQVSNVYHDQIVNACTVEMLKTGQNLSVACAAASKDFFPTLAGYYGYNLIDDCDTLHIFKEDSGRDLAVGQVGVGLNGRLVVPKGSGVPAMKRSVAANLQAPHWPWISPTNRVGYWCPGPAFDTWIKTPAVRTALHVQAGALFFNEDNGEGMQYDPTATNVLPIILDTLKLGLRVMVYSGDADPAINSFVTQDVYWNLMTHSQIPKTNDWQAWTVDNKVDMGGYQFTFGNFSWASIRNSGHMVPEFRPKRSLGLIGQWVDKVWPFTYNPPKTQ